jgi:hypothetical protein
MQQAKLTYVFCGSAACTLDVVYWHDQRHGICLLNVGSLHVSAVQNAAVLLSKYALFKWMTQSDMAQ